MTQVNDFDFEHRQRIVDEQPTIGKHLQGAERERAVEFLAQDAADRLRQRGTYRERLFNPQMPEALDRINTIRPTWRNGPVEKMHRNAQ